MINTYIADLETTHDFTLNGKDITYKEFIKLDKHIRDKKVKVKVREYACGLVELNDETGESFIYTSTIGEMMSVLCREDSKLYFHNLKYDGKFILDWLLRQGFEYDENPPNKMSAYTFNTLIDGAGGFYSIVISFDRKDRGCYTMTIHDSLKIIPFSVKKMVKAFDLKIDKLDEEYDYNKFREVGYILNDEEEKYLKHDVMIVSKSVSFLHHQGMRKMTTASNALGHYKKTIKKSSFKNSYPQLKDDIDKFIRKSYKGGFTYLNKKYKGKVVDRVTTIDVNSLYPSVMYNCKLPYGQPIFFTGKYDDDYEFPLYVQRIQCRFFLKENKIPTLQIKNNFRFLANEYLEDSDGELVELTLTNIDLKLFLEHYDVKDIEYLDGYKFRATDKLFKKYIDYWIDEKIKATDEKNEGMRTIAKLMLNSLYGKFGMSGEGLVKIPHLQDGKVRYTNEESERDTIYIPIAAFITSYAREITIRTCQQITDYSIENFGEDYYIYSDTDSIHTKLDLDTLKQIGVDIHKTKLGAWDYEGVWSKGRYIKSKTYLLYKRLDKDEDIKITCAGMPPSCYDYVNINNFKVGSSFKGKSKARVVEGGVALLPTEFTIK